MVTLESLHPITRELLIRRGVTEPSAIQDFIYPSYEKHIGDPFLIHGMKKAVERVIRAFEGNEKIAIYSDYDCDGIPGGVLLRTFFDDIGYPVEIYVPHRHNEGYGLHNHAFDRLKEKGVKLVITVDLAITNISEVEYAKSLGIDVIVTDHHLPVTEEVVNVRSKKTKAPVFKQVVPNAVAVINSKQDVCTYEDNMLCGCAVAWKLSCAILSTLRTMIPDKNSPESVFAVLSKIKTLPVGFEKWMLDLVGISTIADMVPLQKENRALAYFGLKVLRQTKRPGLQQIFKIQGVSREWLTEDDIAFTIAPRVNAASRMGDPITAHYALYAKDQVTGEHYVSMLEDLNTLRKVEVKDIVSDLSFDHECYQDNVVVVGNLSWGPGILGLVAQKIIDEVGKPTFVWGRGEGDGLIKGSCRSKGDIHVVDLMKRVEELFPGILAHSGGHEQAGGFACEEGYVKDLRDALNEAYKHVEKKEILDNSCVPDMRLSFSDVGYAAYEAVSALSPFGVGNPKPLFSFENSVSFSWRWFGKKGEHFEVIYKVENREVKAIMFFAPKEVEELVKKEHTLLAHLERSVFRGKIEMRLRIVRFV